VEHFLENYPSTEFIFISTDDEEFLNYAKSTPFGRPIVYRNDSSRSSNGEPLHYRKTDKREITRDAIVNCLILSRCGHLIKTASILSAWAKIFNPELPIIMLNKPFDGSLWFPENEILDHVLYQPIR
jgi:hypothetical protein